MSHLDENFWILISFILFIFAFVRFFGRHVMQFLRTLRDTTLGKIPILKQDISHLDADILVLKNEIKELRVRCQEQLLTKQNSVNDHVINQKSIISKLIVKKNKSLQSKLEYFRKDEYAKMQAKMLKLSLRVALKYSKAHKAKHHTEISNQIDQIELHE